MEIELNWSVLSLLLAAKNSVTSIRWKGMLICPGRHVKPIGLGQTPSIGLFPPDVWEILRWMKHIVDHECSQNNPRVKNIEVPLVCV